MPRSRSRPGRYLKGPKQRKERWPRPRNQNQYTNCAATMRKLLKNPNQENWKSFKKAQITLHGINQSMARLLMKKVGENLSVKQLEEFKKNYW